MTLHVSDLLPFLVVTAWAAYAFVMFAVFWSDD